MTNYNDGNWYGWNGGACPVHPETVVEVRFLSRDAEHIRMSDCAELWVWQTDGSGDDIIAFRVIREHREPREVWIRTDDTGYQWLSAPDLKGATLFREVIE